MTIGVFVQLNERSTHAKSQPVGYVIQENGCWDWVGHKDKFGYGRFGKRKARAHRWVYEQAKGPIPKPLVLDHLCRNPSCVNPDHLEPVTDRVNVLRGFGPTAMKARQTHCRLGHPFDEQNTYHLSGRRYCRTCRKRHSANVVRRLTEARRAAKENKKWP